jgi:malate dehydrogenase (oxaloacetate-decarboxylating)(NADP+)
LLARRPKVAVTDLITSAMVEEGATVEEARRTCWFVDTKGLVVRGRDGLAEHKLRFAHDIPYRPDFLSALRALGGTFDERCP